jgi:hypothetical protein
MSLGFGVGDIILLSQLAYKLYGAVTSGRKETDRDLRELQSALFGLQCALDHLAKIRSTIGTETVDSPRTPNQHDCNVQSNLGKIIQSCGETLEDLATATATFRNEAGITDYDVEGEGNQNPIAHEKRHRVWLDRFKKNLIKIRWDMTKQDLKHYRDRLQSHADAINIILNTILWYVDAVVLTRCSLRL